jgi:hypothetical protein
MDDDGNDLFFCFEFPGHGNLPLGRIQMLRKEDRLAKVGGTHPVFVT